MKKPSLINIFITYAKIGVLTFGGGYAMLPFFEKEVVETNKWIDKQQMLDFYALGQSLPGLIAVNVSVISTYNMFKDFKDCKISKPRKVLACICASLGVIIPSIIIILIIAALLGGFRENEYVQHALGGITICVLALIVSSVIKLVKSAITDIPQLLICLIALAISLLTDISPIICLIGGAAVGIIYNLIMRRTSS